MVDWLKIKDEQNVNRSADLLYPGLYQEVEALSSWGVPTEFASTLVPSMSSKISEHRG